MPSKIVSTPKQLNTPTSSPTKRSPKSWKQRASVIGGVFLTGLCLSAYLQRIICQNWQQISQQIYGFNAITHNLQKLTVLKQTLLYMSILQIIISKVIINIRIFSQKTCPVAEKDPLSISLLNRILSNNIEQSFVFFGLYSYLLLSTNLNLDIHYAFSLPLIFIIGRVLFCLAYILATVIGIATVRSFGFAFGVFVNFFMISQLIFNFSDIYKTFLFA